MTQIEERKAHILIEMRGYQLIERSELKGGVEFLTKNPRPEETVLIWCASKRVGVEFLRKMRHKMNAVGAERGAVIASLTHAAKTLAREERIELIPENFPSFNILKHKLVPLHEILTEEEREEMLTKYRVNAYQLPRIATSDPPVIAIGGRPGDIIRIVRDSPTSGKHVFYRYVVE